MFRVVPGSLVEHEVEVLSADCPTESAVPIGIGAGERVSDADIADYL